MIARYEVMQIKGQNVLIFPVNKRRSRQHQDRRNSLIRKLKVRWIDGGNHCFYDPAINMAEMTFGMEYRCELIGDWSILIHIYNLQVREL